VEHAVGVRPLLDAVADLAELGRLLEHAGADPAPREGERARHPADAAAAPAGQGARPPPPRRCRLRRRGFPGSPCCSRPALLPQNRQTRPAMASPWAGGSPLICPRAPPL